MHTALRFAVYLYKTRIFVSKVFETNKTTSKGFKPGKGKDFESNNPTRLFPERMRDEFVDFSLQRPLPLCRDIKIVFYNRRTRIFRFWFNTYFVDVHKEAQLQR